MSLIHDLDQIIRSAESMRAKAAEQQRVYYALINGLVALRQTYRLEKRYDIADELRALLDGVGVEIVQGTAGYAFSEIPAVLKGRQVADTWALRHSEAKR